MATQTPPQEPQTRLEAASVAAQQRLREFTAAAVTRAWENLGGYDDTDVARFLAVAIPLVRAAQRQAVSLTDAYVARALDRRPLGIDPQDILPTIRGGGLATPDARDLVAPEIVYRRPFVTTWTALADGKPFDTAVREGQHRASSLAATDVLLAMTHTTTEIARRDKTITGWERVPDASACPLCLIASTQRYHREQLMPIHDHCNCGVRPLTDPIHAESGRAGQIINRELYKQLKRDGVIDRITAQQQKGRARERAEGNRERANATRDEARTERDPRRRVRLEQRAASWDVRAARQDVIANGPDVAVRLHGELGPVLTNAGHAFKGPSDIPQAV